MIKGLIGFVLMMGLLGWIIHLIFIMQSLRSKKKWTIFIDYNTLHEGVSEILLLLTIIIFNIFVLMEFL